MLLRLVVNNFLSIAEELDFQMFPYNRLREMKDHIYKTAEIDLLKAAAIYGANGSGKSNLVKAIAYLQDFVVNNSVALQNKPPRPFRLEDKYLSLPCRFELEFFSGKRYFHYGVSLSAYTVEEEFLYLINPVKDTSELVFSRKRNGEGKQDVTLNARFQQSEKDKARVTIYVEELLKSTESLLHLLAKNEAFAEMQEAFNWLSNQLIVIQPQAPINNLVEALHDDKELVDFSNQLLQTLDTGVSDIGLYGTSYEMYFGKDEPERKQQILTELASGKPYVKIEINDEIMLAKLRGDRLMIFRVATHHLSEGDEKMMFFPDEESDGTRRVFDFLPLWALLINKPYTIVIDEIGRSLHPNLLDQLIRFFMQTATKGQLIFTTHEANLLQRDIFRRDEIWMLEKSERGSSKITPLSEFNIRHDLDVRKSYLQGRFGGVPKLSHLFSDEFVTHE